MINWTQSAHHELESYWNRVRLALAGSGADAGEVIDDLRRHVHAEISAAKLAVVTRDDVQRITARLGSPVVEMLDEPEGTAPSTPPPAPSLDRVRHPGFLVLVFCVVLPLITFGLELATGMCAESFFDPMPDFAHVLLVGLVPVANWFCWRAARTGETRRLRLLSVLLGVSTVVSAWYSVLFLPLMPFAVIGILVFGWGLLPLSPIIAFAAAFRLRTGLRSLAPDMPRLVGYGSGVLIGALLVACLQIRSIASHIGIRMTTSESATTRANGLRLLRTMGSETVLLQKCYSTRRDFGDFISELLSESRRVSPERARQLYFRVYGRPFNSAAAPKDRPWNDRWRIVQPDFDAGLGGETVAGRVRGVSLASSRMDGIVDAEAAVSYTEWTLEFRNDSPSVKEARAQILLPPDGVVSRLTLWINGEAREAAFGGRSLVREAYQQVAVVQRRNPVLVTTSGPDRVLMQCFPIPADGGIMKVRLGITAPLALENVSEARLRLPAFLERNFDLTDETTHAVWLESSGLAEVRAAGFNVAPSSSGTAIRASLTDAKLTDPSAGIVFRRSGTAEHDFAAIRAGGRIRQQTISTTSPALRRLVVVVDGSASMTGTFSDIATAFAAIPASADLRLVIAGDQVRVPEGKGATRDRLAGHVRTMKAAGGQDNISALVRAWDLASEVPDSAVIWIHGPQPVLLGDVEALRQRLERHPFSPRIFDVQTHVGPNRVVEKLTAGGTFIQVHRAGALRDDLRTLIRRCQGEIATVRLVREKLGGSIPESTIEGVAAGHVERLWARDEVVRLKAWRKLDEAVALARTHQLVTPVSGAVVLETAAQYAASGLTPVDADSVPAVPEPATWALMAVGFAALVVLLRRRKPVHAGS